MESDRLPELSAHPSSRNDEELARLLARDPARAEEFWSQAGLDALLAARHGKVPAREDLWDRVWGEIEREQGTSEPRRRSWRARRRPQARGGSGPRWIWMAAAALFGVIVLLSLPSRETGRGGKAARRPSTTPVREEPPEERPRNTPPDRKEPLKTERPRIASPEPEAPPPAPEAPKPLPFEPKTEPPRPEVRPPVPEKPAPGRSTVVAFAGTLGRVEGEVSCTGPEGRRPARSGEPLPAGHGVECGPGKSAAGFVYADATRLELGPSTAVRDLSDAAGAGKRLSLDRGTLAADVVKQDRPMVVTTPNAEARVVGTAFRITVDPSGGSTRLEVTKGKVRLTRLSDGRFTDVGAGQFAVAGAGPPPSAKAIPSGKANLLLAEAFEDPRGVEDRWKRTSPSFPVKTAGRLEIDLAPRAAQGWNGGGLQTRQTFAPPLAVSVDVEIPELHSGLVATVSFVPQGQARGGDGVFRVQLRDRRYSVFTERGEPREIAGADRATGAPCRERWRVEIEANRVRLLADGREVVRHAHDLQVPAGYAVELDGSARPDAPAGARAAFDNVVIEQLKP